MNWFTKRHVGHLSIEKKKETINDPSWGGNCEHVEKDSSKLYMISAENDPWGREDYGICEECANKLKETEDNEQVCCSDCKKMFPRKETITWKWYDFYAAQGDVPLTICNTCRTAEKHQTRVANDRADYMHEMGHLENNHHDYFAD